MSPSLGGYWHPICESGDVIEQPRRLMLLGRPLVAFRHSDGVSVFADLCIHRGTALSLGEVVGDRLVCAYHGWQYDRAGACVHIPALPPGASIPKKARALVHHAREKYGLVWVALTEPVADIPPWERDAWNDPAYEVFLTGRAVVATSAGRVIENAMDFSHLNIVHRGYTELADGPVIQAHEVRAAEGGLEFEYDDTEIIRRYRLHVPFTLHDTKVKRNGDTSILTFIASPIGEDQAEVYRFTSRNHSGATGTFARDQLRDREEVRRTSLVVFEQDRTIIESQRPQLIPTDLRDELHLRVPDAAGIAYRRLLGGIADIAPHLP